MVRAIQTAAHEKSAMVVGASACYGAWREQKITLTGCPRAARPPANEGRGVSAVCCLRLSGRDVGIIETGSGDRLHGGIQVT